MEKQATNKMMFFISVPVALIFWFILNLVFSAPYVEVSPSLSLEEMLASPVFLVFMALSFLELVFIWRSVIPVAKANPRGHLLAYVMPEVVLVFGFVAGFIMQSVTPYLYFLPVWLVGMALVYREVYSAA